MNLPQTAALIEGHLDLSDFHREESFTLNKLYKAKYTLKEQTPKLQFSSWNIQQLTTKLFFTLESSKWHHCLWNALAQRYVFSGISACIALQRLVGGGRSVYMYHAKSRWAPLVFHILWMSLCGLGSFSEILTIHKQHLNMQHRSHD